MPATNPLVDADDQAAPPLVTQAVRPGALTTPSRGGPMNPSGPAQGTQVNAAGTSENVAMHVAAIVAFALIGIYVLRASGFRFVAAGSIGVGR